MKTALIVGAGSGNSAALTRLLASKGYQVHLAARDITKLHDLCHQTNANAHVADAKDPASVKALFDAVQGRLDVVVANPSARVRGPVATLDADEVKHAIDVTAFGSFLVGQQAAARMLAQSIEDGARGTILFTGASAGVKGFAQSAAFAMGKFAQRGLAQSMARELHPQGIHVAWINIDGGIRNPGRVEPADNPDSMLDPDAVAQSYFSLISQHRSAWSDELSIRPWVEKF